MQNLKNPKIEGRTNLLILLVFWSTTSLGKTPIGEFEKALLEKTRSKNPDNFTMATFREEQNQKFNNINDLVLPSKSGYFEAK